MTTYLQTLMHLIKGIIGAGLFSMGIAFKNAGMVIALIFTPIMGLIVLHCVTLVVRVVERKKSEEKSAKYLTESSIYADIVERVFLDGPDYVQPITKYMKVIVNLAICFMNLGFCCVYVVFVAKNMEKALHFFGIDLDVHLIMLIFIVPMWLSSLITNLKLLAPVSVVANGILVAAIGITLYFLCDRLPRFDSVEYVGDISTMPLFFGVALYTYECIALILPLRNEMDQPEKLIGPFGILNMGFLIVIPIVLVLGFLSYLKFGEDIQGTVFLNLPENNTLVQSLIILVCIQVLFTYPVQMYAPVTILWPMVTNRLGPFKRPLFSLLCFRTLLVLLTLAIGEAIPFIDLIISLIGAISSSCLTVFLPPFMEMIVFYNKELSPPRKAFLLIKNSILGVLAVAVFITGIFASVRDIIAAF